MQRQGFLDFIDLVDGGGAGARGSQFEGGGLLSDISNALFQPYGYREKMRGMQETRPMARPDSIMRAAITTPPTSMPQPGPEPTPIQPDPEIPSGPVRPMPMGSGMTPANNYVGPAQTAPQMPQGPAMPPMPTVGVSRAMPSPMMPSGSMPQEVPAPTPMGVNASMAQLEGALTPSERQALMALPMEQRIGMIQRLIQMRQGGM